MILFTLTFLSVDVFADWPQWRGPHRNGLADGTSKLPGELTEENAPVKLWETTGIPSDHYGGHGSVSIANGRLYLSVVWHEDVPTEKRRIDGGVLSTLGYRGTGGLPEETVKKMEDDRRGLSRRMRGAALDEYAKKWIEENLDEKTQLSLGSWVASRFKKGSAAIPLSVYEDLQKASKLVFDGQTEMEKWVNEQGFDPIIAQQIIAAVPSTEKKAKDTVICYDASTGEEKWKFETEGYPSGRSSSSTPGVFGGKVYAALSENLYCLDANSGEEKWRAPLTGRKGPASSPLVSNGRVYLQQNLLTAHDAETGEKLWENKDAKGANTSPAVWKNVILCNSSKEIVGIDGETGATSWTQPGGGDGTPVVSGDHLVLSSKLEGANLIAYKLSDGGAEKLWSKEFLARRYGSSPIVYEGNVYHLGSERHMCVDLKSGEIKWEKQAQSSISSPLLADGKLLVYENRGGFLSFIKATSDSHQSLGKAKVGALYCASPALVGQDLFLRTQESVACYRFE